MWFIFITARLLIFLSFQPRLTATLLRPCSVVNSLTRRAGLSPAFQPTSLAQPLINLYSGAVKWRMQLRGAKRV
jgi:fucose 4-O-acetylase-like acetyltransferase